MKSIPCLVAMLTLAVTSWSQTSGSQTGQLGAELEWIPIPGTDWKHLGQRSRDGTLQLTPNEVFFPKLGLENRGEGSLPDVKDLNKGSSFREIGKWDAGDEAEWGIWVERPGQVEVILEADGGTFSLHVGEDEVPFKGGQASLSLATPGRHSLILTCEEGGAATVVRGLTLTGSAIGNAAVLRKRWRPAAAHTKFSSAAVEGPVRLWIMEMDAVPGDLGFYAPITTPFGYYGPSWLADGRVNTSFNFSLWSFGRGKEEPPIEQLSHLLAVGSPEASFSGFDHEGTGVKVRDWDPLEGRQGQRQALALRVEPGPVYDTYFSYFYAADEGRWRLFGIGNKYHGGKSVEDLWVGSFVEVPGPSPVQRTGPYERRMRYRGWVMTEGGQWHALDRMQTGNIDPETGLTHTHRGVTEDGWFFMETGGWNYRPGATEPFVELRPSQPTDAPYLNAEGLAYLQTVPSEIVATQIERSGEHARVTFQIRNLGEGGKATLFWGSEEGLTLAGRWAHEVVIPEVKEGENQFVWQGVPEGSPVHARLLLENAEGKFWTPATVVAE